MDESRDWNAFSDKVPMLDALRDLSPRELGQLLVRPAVGHFSTQNTTQAPLPQCVEIYLSTRPVSGRIPPSELLELSSEQQEKIRTLQVGILRKLGIADEVLALTEMRGTRVDPFTDPDDEEPKGEEE